MTKDQLKPCWYWVFEKVGHLSAVMYRVWKPKGRPLTVYHHGTTKLTARQRDWLLAEGTWVEVARPGIHMIDRW